MKLKTIAFSILILFSLLGAVVISITIHEFSHYYDFKKIVVNDSRDELCILNVPLHHPLDSDNKLGYYSFYIHSNETERFDEINKYTEIRAWGLFSLGIILWCLCIIAAFKNKIYVVFDKVYEKYGNYIYKNKGK